MKTNSTLPPASIRSVVDQVISSPDFKASTRLCRFLHFIVEESLSGRADRIKAYNIATSVLGRGVDFDPQTDPIVRIEAGRLRHALEHYYLTSGKNDSVRISVPKGAYVPEFRLADPPAERPVASPPTDGATSEPDDLHPPSVLVVPFVIEGDVDQFPGFGHGLTRKVIVALTRFCDLIVYGPETSFDYGAPKASEGVGPELASDYRLSGGVTLEPRHFAVEVMLSETETGQVVWADRFEAALDPSGVLEWREKVAEKVARIIAQPYGVLFSRRAQEVEGKHAHEWNSYDCVNRYYHYSRTLSRDGNSEVINCLEETIAREPHFAEAFACLSQAYCDAYRCGFPIGNGTDDPLGRAMALALRSIELAPRSSLGFHALGHAYWFQNDIDAALEAFETGLALNPNATGLMAELGQKLATLAGWERAVPLLEKSFARNPAQPGTYRIGLSLYHFSQGRFQQALSEAQKIGASDVVYTHIMEAISLIRLGRMDDAKAAVGRVIEIRPDYGPVVGDDLALRNTEPKLASEIIRALQDAGLPGVPGTALRAEPPNLRQVN